MFTFFKPRKNPMPQLRLYNTLSDKVEPFLPLKNGEVRMYSCGPTAYDRQHIGNLFPPVAADTVHRALLTWGYKVKQVINITDFGHISEDDAGEDKMTKGLRKDGMALTLENMRALAEKYAALFFLDLPDIGIDPSKIKFPRASDYIPDQIALIKSLEQKGYAYTISDGVYFDTSKFHHYGKLGHINLEGQLAGARVEEQKEKKTSYDFALWKFDQKLGWESPWGLGFPGWHTECVAMIFALLGKQIDIHMGGVDLVGTHHNNEIAQAEALTDKKYVGYWLHNAHITIENKKVSKSLGNTVYLHNLTDRGISSRALRYWFLTGHYRTPMNFTWEAIEGANTALQRLQKYFFEELSQAGLGEPNAKFLDKFYNAIAEDLNTAKALAHVWDLIKDHSISPTEKRASLLLADKLLGLGLSEKRAYSKITITRESDLPEDIRRLVRERDDARLDKNFNKSDELRIAIEKAGFEVKDTKEGQKLTKR